MKVPIALSAGVCHRRLLDLRRISEYLLRNGHVLVDSPQGADCVLGYARDRDRLWCRLAEGAWRLLFRSRLRRYDIQVEWGCLSRCTYCADKRTVGESRSKPIEACLAELREGLRLGYRDIKLLGDDVGSWGQDLGSDFIELLDRASSMEGRYALTVKEMNVAWIVEHLDRLVPILARGRFSTFHLGIQSGNDRVLAAMGREYARDDILRIADALRPILPLTTSIIAGFPTETEEEFEDSLSLLERIDPMGGDIFIYQDRPGTPAAVMEPKVPEEAKVARLRRAAERLGRRYRIRWEPDKLSFDRGWVQRVLFKVRQKRGAVPPPVGRSRRPASPRRPRRALWLHLATGAAILLALLIAVRPREVFEAAAGFRPSALLPFGAGVLLEGLLGVLSLYLLVRVASRGSIALRSFFAPSLRCWILAGLTPGRAGDFALSEFFDDDSRRGSILAAVTIQKLLTLAILVAASLATLIVGERLPHAWLAVGACGLLIAAAAAVIHLPRIRRFLRRRLLGANEGLFAGFGRAIDRIERSPWTLAASLLVTVVRIAAGSLCLSALLWGLGEDPAVLRVLLGAPLFRLSSLIPISLFGIGIQECAWILILEPAGVPPRAILAAHVIWRPVGLAIQFLLLLLLRGPRGGSPGGRRRQREGRGLRRQPEPARGR